MGAEAFPRFARCVSKFPFADCSQVPNLVTLTYLFPVYLFLPAVGFGHEGKYTLTENNLAEPTGPFATLTHSSRFVFLYIYIYSYDVYTPTRNIVFHDYGPNPSGHDMNEWFKQRRGSLRQESLDRIKAFLHIRGPVDTSETALANMGIYGLGKRRSLSQLYKFTGIDMNTMKVDKEVRRMLLVV
jgi:hypothetical protein